MDKTNKEYSLQGHGKNEPLKILDKSKSFEVATIVVSLSPILHKYNLIIYSLFVNLQLFLFFNRSKVETTTRKKMFGKVYIHNN